jgi:pimeloyl-ACP methyl ester carboxylesterase
MKHINIYLFIVMAVFSVIGLNAQDRNVVWVHGMGGDQSAWEYYETAFTRERQMNGHRNKYETRYGIDYAAGEVISDVSTSVGSNSQNIAIGHSMGGLMVRDVERLPGGNGMFGGLITVNSPNYGAPIANSISDGSLDGIISDACNKLTAGPLNQGFPIPWVIMGSVTNDVLCHILSNIDIIQDIAGSSTTRTDLSVGSAAISRINSFPTTTPRISIWSYEDSPVHWRLASSFDTDRDNDTKIKDWASTARSIYNAHYAQNMTLGATTPFPFNILYFNRAAQWKKGIDWIDNSESIWCSLIKTTRIETSTYSYWDYRCVYVWTDPDPMKTIAPPPDECEWQWVYVTKTTNVSVNYPSDGLLPEYTQKLQGIPSGNI